MHGKFSKVAVVSRQYSQIEYNHLENRANFSPQLWAEVFHTFSISKDLAFLFQPSGQRREIMITYNKGTYVDICHPAVQSFKVLTGTARTWVNTRGTNVGARPVCKTLIIDPPIPLKSCLLLELLWHSELVVKSSLPTSRQLCVFPDLFRPTMLCSVMMWRPMNYDWNMKESNKTKLNTLERPIKGKLPPPPQNAAEFNTNKTSEKIWGQGASLGILHSRQKGPSSHSTLLKKPKPGTWVGLMSFPNRMKTPCFRSKAWRMCFKLTFKVCMCHFWDFALKPIPLVA